MPAAACFPRTAAGRFCAAFRTSCVAVAGISGCIRGLAQAIDGCRRLRGLLRKQQLNLSADLPVRAVIGPYYIVVSRELGIHRQLAEMEDLADAGTQRKG